MTTVLVTNVLVNTVLVKSFEITATPAEGLDDGSPVVVRHTLVA